MIFRMDMFCKQMLYWINVRQRDENAVITHKTHSIMRFMTAKPSPTHPSSGDMMHNLDIYSKCWLLEYLRNYWNITLSWKSSPVFLNFVHWIVIFTRWNYDIYNNNLSRYKIFEFAIFSKNLLYMFPTALFDFVPRAFRCKNSYCSSNK